ncbi:hypothetical protein BB561_003850 [Smittium simulii]|uniref:Uncharacterized protein n=1 Tax=Smittium simulii TaxID=133385 RepID=A0A2T9YJ72_9FUNG|nr:hypothetical protein BB561_003850 [Smittium simulii]
MSRGESICSSKSVLHLSKVIEKYEHYCLNAEPETPEGLNILYNFASIANQDPKTEEQSSITEYSFKAEQRNTSCTESSKVVEIPKTTNFLNDDNHVSIEFYQADNPGSSTAPFLHLSRQSSNAKYRPQYRWLVSTIGYFLISSVLINGMFFTSAWFIREGQDPENQTVLGICVFDLKLSNIFDSFH